MNCTSTNTFNPLSTDALDKVTWGQLGPGLKHNHISFTFLSIFVAPVLSFCYFPIHTSVSVYGVITPLLSTSRLIFFFFFFFFCHYYYCWSCCIVRMMFIQESDAGILGKKKYECSYQESNLRPADY